MDPCSEAAHPIHDRKQHTRPADRGTCLHARFPRPCKLGPPCRSKPCTASIGCRTSPNITPCVMKADGSPKQGFHRLQDLAKQDLAKQDLAKHDPASECLPRTLASSPSCRRNTTPHASAYPALRAVGEQPPARIFTCRVARVVEAAAAEVPSICGPPARISTG